MNWIKANRLKAVSALFATGDFLIALAGSVGLMNPGRIDYLPDLLLMINGALALLANGCILLWGKGAKSENISVMKSMSHTPLWLKILMPWRYPLDSAFFCFVLSGVLYAVIGWTSVNIGFMGVGILVAIASAIGWLWPQDKLIGRFRAVQITAMMYGCSSIFTFIASIIANSIAVFAAGCCFGLANVILYTVRKENQSAYTQSHEPA